MSRDFRHGLKQSAKSGYKNEQQDVYGGKDIRVPTKRRIEDTLRAAVRHQDVRVFEDYDEHEL